jgi:predicted aspartyl protease
MEMEPRQMAEIVEQSLREFNSAMQHREQAIVKMGNQTAQMIRVSMIGLILVLCAVFALIAILLSDMGNITKSLKDVVHHMANVNQNIVLMTENMNNVKHSVDLVRVSIDGVEKHIRVMPLMQASVDHINDNIFAMNDSIHDINTSIKSLNNNITVMGVDMARINQQFSSLNYQLNGMGSNINSIAAPIKMLPFPR